MFYFYFHIYQTFYTFLKLESLIQEVRLLFIVFWKNINHVRHLLEKSPSWLNGGELMRSLLHK